MRFFARLAVCLVVAASMAAAAACSDTKVVVARAPDVDLSGLRVSVFGVYSDGRWNAAEWDRLRERMHGLGKGGCELGFGEPLRDANKELYVAIDKEARSSGITDKLVTLLSPGAQGDVVLVIEVWGALGPVQSSTPSEAPPPAAGTGGVSTPSGMGGSGLTHIRPPAGSSLGGGRNFREQDALRMVARVYAPDLKEWVGGVELRYSGDDPNEAIARFDEALGQLVPSARCAGWSWKAPASAASTAASSAPPIVVPAPSSSATTQPSSTTGTQPY